MNKLSRDFLISDDESLIDLEAVCRLLSTTYWASQRTPETIHKAIRHSKCYGIYDQGRQVGFARVVTDYATVYYLCDVIIDEHYRGAGLGKQLIERIIHDFEDIGGLLRTADAHGLYAQYGFVRDTDRFMNRMPK